MDSKLYFCRVAPVLFLLFMSPVLYSQCRTLVWSDEFNSSSLDASNWSYEVGNGCSTSAGCWWGNNEKEYYTDDNNVTVTGGNLEITSKYEPNYNNSGLDYTSARIITLGKQSWKFGHIEAKIQVPSAQGVWPAFWMLPVSNNWPYTGEIDILEAKNKNPSVVYQTIHYWCTPCGNHQYTGVTQNMGTDISAGYHIYAVDWSPGQIQYSVDGTVTATYTKSPSSLVGGQASDWTFDDQNFYILFNVAVGGDFTGTTPVSSDYPVSMLVDYVRVYTNSGCVLSPDFSASETSSCVGNNIIFTDLTTNKIGGETYSWNFGAGASPATSSSSGPVTVKYSTSGQKTVSLTVTNSNGVQTKTKTNYIIIADPPTDCIFSDDFNDNVVNWISPNPGAFAHAETGDAWNISNSGYPEWEYFTYTLNNGSTASPLNFYCVANKPIVHIRAKASSNALLRMTMMDASGRAIDNYSSIDLELTTSYQTFDVDYSSHFVNYYGSSPGVVDSSNINQLQFYVNPGYVSYPITGSNATYNTSFAGTIDIDWIGIGDNCTSGSLPVNITNFKGIAYNEYSVLAWNTEKEISNGYFIIEKSFDGMNFFMLDSIRGGDSYVYKDVSFFSNAYYRLIQIEADGRGEVSKIIALSDKSEANDEIKILPNPAEGNSFSISATKDISELIIYDLMGRQIFSTELKKSSSIKGEEIPFTFNKGIYMIRTSNDESKKKLIIR